jgi:hypothetical protein
MTDDKYGMFFAVDKHNEDGVDLEKFAELLVQECCDVITPYTIKDGVMFDVSTNLHPIYVLKKHFGVEE